MAYILSYITRNFICQLCWQIQNFLMKFQRLGKCFILSHTIKNRKIFFLILIITTSVHINTLGNQFIWDDTILITPNYLIKDWKYLPDIFTTTIFQTTYGTTNFYRPLQSLSYMFDYSFWRLNPFGYHLTNVIFHLLNTLLVFVLTKFISKNKTVSFIASLLFGINAIQTETVAYISSRADLMCIFFLLLSFIAYIVYIKRLNQKNQHIQYYLLSLLSFILAILSKEIALALPLLLILFDFTFPNIDSTSNLEDKKNSSGNNLPRFSQRHDVYIRIYNRIIKRYSAFFIIFFAYILFRLFFFKPGGPFSAIPNSFYLRFITAPKIIWSYICLLLLPLNLHMERFILPPQSPVELIALITFIVITLGAIAKSYNRSKIIFFGASWFFITLLPSLNLFFPLNAQMSEHWLYLPSIGFFIFIACAAEIILNTKILKFKAAHSKIFILSVFVLIAIFYSTTTIMRNKEWGDEITFFEGILKYNTGINKCRAHSNLARIYFAKGLYDEAETEIKKALKISPQNADSLCVIGIIYGNKGLYNEAETQLKKAININPRFAEAYYNLGVTYFLMGNLEGAINIWQKLTQINPYYENVKENIIRAKNVLYKN